MNRSCLILLVLGAALAGQSRAAEIRYEDIVYLDEVRAKPLALKTNRRVPLTVSRDQSTVLAYLAADHKVWVRGFGETRYYVETLISTGKARGWVDIEAVETVPEEVRADIEGRVATARHHKQLIGRHEIEVGMTKAQVQAALGKPDERSRTQTGGGVEEEWTYRLYKSIPQREYYYGTDGKLRDRVYYRKVPAGGKTVTFREDLVMAIKDEDKLPEASPPIVTLPPPVIRP